MKKVLRIVLPILIIGLVAVTMISGSASALTLKEGVEAVRCDECPADLFGDAGVFKQITNTVLYIVVIVAVIMLIIGGIRYVVSGGDSKKVTDAKNTVLYAIIGLVISLLSFAIVNFVMASLPNSNKNVENNDTETSVLIDLASS